MTTKVQDRRLRGFHVRGAFTLIELVIVVLIMGILASVAAPQLVNTINRVRLNAACNRIKADLLLARQNAMSKSATQSVQFNTVTRVYTLAGMGDINRTNLTYSVDLSKAPFEVAIPSAVLGADSEIRFDYFGQPDSGGVITVRSGSLQQTVTVDANSGLASTP